MLWDVWLAQKVGKLKAKWESKRRRARDEAGDAEETNVSQDIQPPQELQIQRPEAVKRRVQAGSSTDRIVAEEDNSGPSRTNSQRGMEFEATMDPTPVVDVKTHNISMKLGLFLIAGFFGKLRQHTFDIRLTLHSILFGGDGRPWYHPQPNIAFRFVFQHVSCRYNHLWRRACCDPSPALVRRRSGLGLPERLPSRTCHHSGISRTQLQFLCLPWSLSPRIDGHTNRTGSHTLVSRNLLSWLDPDCRRTVDLAGHED